MPIERQQERRAVDPQPGGAAGKRRYQLPGALVPPRGAGEAVEAGADHGLAPEAGGEGRVHVDHLRAAGQVGWPEVMRQAKDLGAIDIEACSLSMDLLGIGQADLDPLVDGIEGITAFYINAGDGQLLFI